MILIMKHGRNKKLLIDFHCFYCGCDFKADSDDFTQIFTSDGSETAYICDCPDCGTEVYTNIAKGRDEE